jgi:phage terminase Nu1 subunit (DNA packaging protein)
VAKPKKPDEKWIAANQAELAKVLGSNLKTVQSWALQGMPGTPGRYSVVEVIAWLRTSGPWRPHQRLEPDAGDSESPGLERLRAAKAELAELELAERKQLLLSRDQVRAVHNRWATILKRAGEAIRKLFGAAPAEKLTDALDECDRVVRNEFSAEPPNGPAG